MHIDKMPVENTVFDEHRDILSLYWTTQDVLAFLAETSDDPHLLKIKELGEPHANGTTEANDADGDSNGEGAVGSKQYQKSARRVRPKFDGLRTTPSGHKIQDVKELMPIPVIITSDVTKSPPVLVVYACEWSVRYPTPD